jgi:hypothetical protein
MKERIVASITVAAYLAFKGEKLIRLERLPGRKYAGFVFEDSPTLRQHQGEYFSSPFEAYYTEVHKLKALANELSRSNLI